MSRCEVGVALCTFNGDQYLSEQLASIGRQSRHVDEIVVGDDGSSDRTVPILRQAAAYLPIELLAGTGHALGAAANFGRTLERCSSRFIFLCDQDDVWHDDKVLRLMDALDADPHRLMVASDARIIDRFGTPDGCLSSALRTTAAKNWSSRDWMFALLRRNRVTGATAACRRELLDIALPIPEGFWHDEWLATMAAACDGLVWIDECLTDYRIHDRNAAGLRRVGLKATVAGAAAGGSSHHAAKGNKLQSLADRLRQRGYPVSPARLRQVEAAVSFWGNRAALPKSTFRRAAFVAETMLSGDYFNFGDGMKSAFRDLLEI